MNDKYILSNKFEIDGLEEEFKELDNVDDLWYFVKANNTAWIAGSTGDV